MRRPREHPLGTGEWVFVDDMEDDRSDWEPECEDEGPNARMRDRTAAIGAIPRLESNAAQGPRIGHDLTYAGYYGQDAHD